VVRLAESQHGVVARRQVLGIGLTRHMISGRLAVGTWRTLYPGVYRLRGAPQTWYQRLMAACLAAGSDAVASHRAAANLWGLGEFGDPVEVTVPAQRRVRLPDVTLHRATRLSSGEICRVHGIPATVVSRTLIDLATVLDKSGLEAAVDRALADRLVASERLHRSLEAAGRSGRKGAGHLARILEQRISMKRLPQSEFELRLLRLLERHRLPAPICQHRVRLSSGRWAYLDFAYPDALLALEADSYRHHSSLSDWSRDRVRNNELLALGWRVLPVTFSDLGARPAMIADQVARALRAAEVWNIRPL
jgi:very-short-patch-repair endonuclease